MRNRHFPGAEGGQFTLFIHLRINHVKLQCVHTRSVLCSDPSEVVVLSTDGREIFFMGKLHLSAPEHCVSTHCTFLQGWRPPGDALIFFSVQLRISFFSAAAGWHNSH